MNTALKIRRIREKRRKAGIASGVARRKKMMERPREEKRPRLDAGELPGVLQWHGLDGTVHRYTVTQAPRRNQILAESLGGTIGPCGFDWLLRKLRTHLAPLQR